VSELVVAARLIELGHEVFWPVKANTPVDLVYRPRGSKRFVTVQVKTAHCRGKDLRVHTRNHIYSSSSFDVLMCVDPSGRVFEVAWASVWTRKTLNVENEMLLT